MGKKPYPTFLVILPYGLVWEPDLCTSRMACSLAQNHKFGDVIIFLNYDISHGILDFLHLFTGTNISYTEGWGRGDTYLFPHFVSMSTRL
jgi:hypothetical protein